MATATTEEIERALDFPQRSRLRRALPGGDEPPVDPPGEQPPGGQPAPKKRGGVLRRMGSSVKETFSWRSFKQRSRRFFPWLLMLILIGAVIAYIFYRAILVVVRDGEAGVIYRLFLDGVDTEQIYGEGLHVIWPWNRMTIYNQRIQTVLHELTVLTNKGLPITLKLAIRYFPEYQMLGVLHQEVGPDYVNTIVIPQIESVLRRDIGRRNPEDIYTNKEGILTSIVLRAIEEAGQKFVNIDDIIIRTVELPADVKDAIDDKIVLQQRWQAYEFRLALERQEAQRKRIEATGVRDFNVLVSESLGEDILSYRGIDATMQLAASNNAKVVIIGGGENGLPIILNTEGGPPPVQQAAAPAGQGLDEVAATPDQAAVQPAEAGVQPPQAGVQPPQTALRSVAGDPAEGLGALTNSQPVARANNPDVGRTDGTDPAAASSQVLNSQPVARGGNPEVGRTDGTDPAAASSQPLNTQPVARGNTPEVGNTDGTASTQVEGQPAVQGLNR